MKHHEISNTAMHIGPVVDIEQCLGCGKCYDICPMDVFGWDTEQQQPIVAYPGECRLCCACELACNGLAIDVRLPVHMMIEYGIAPGQSGFGRINEKV